jgi:ArsR family transcriptional regulator, arsenate/arsenite/antimonite-responsive transcriptional repressor
MDRVQVERISKALADETRLKIFEALCARGQMNCGEIVRMRGVTPATVSYHLRVLNEAGLIECRRSGQFIYSRRLPESIEKYAGTLLKMARSKKSRRKRQSKPP